MKHVEDRRSTVVMQRCVFSCAKPQNPKPRPDHGNNSSVGSIDHPAFCSIIIIITTTGIIESTVKLSFGNSWGMNSADNGTHTNAEMCSLFLQEKEKEKHLPLFFFPPRSIVFFGII
jgi:hypothetical protein